MYGKAGEVFVLQDLGVGGTHPCSAGYTSGPQRYFRDSASGDVFGQACPLLTSGYNVKIYSESMQVIIQAPECVPECKAPPNLITY